MPFLRIDTGLLVCDVLVEELPWGDPVSGAWPARPMATEDTSLEAAHSTSFVVGTIVAEAGVPAHNLAWAVA